MEPGTGKTRTACELIKSVKNIDSVFWFTPCQTIHNLYNEIQLFGSLDNLNIIGIESISQSDRIYLETLNDISKCTNPFIVCDESLKIKNISAIRTQRFLELSKNVEYKLILNGTPLSKNLLDLWSQFEFLSPKILNMPLIQFKNTFCEYTTLTKRKGNQKIVREWINAYHNVEYLYSLIKHYVYECDLSIEIQKQYFNNDYTIDEDARIEYEKLKEYFLNEETLFTKNNNIFLELTQKMQHCYSCSKEKFDIVKRILKTQSPENTLIYCKYIASSESVKTQFPNTKVMTYGKHAYGLNLQNYNAIIFFDKTWDYAQRTQTEFRIFRTGQKENCKYYDLSGDVPLETLMNDNINKKQNLLQYLKKLTIEELKEVL